MDTCICCVLILIILLFRPIVEGFTSPTKPVCNDIDGHCYDIVSSFSSDTHGDASKKLAMANKFMIDFLRYERNNYLWGNKGSQYHQEIIARMMDHYRPGSLLENNPPDDVNTSYVEDKGKKFAICLREKKSGKNYFHPDELIHFILIHELAHLSANGYGHGLEYWVNFKILLSDAAESGLYKPINYKKNPFYYCSLFVDYNPLFDDEIPLLK